VGDLATLWPVLGGGGVFTVLVVVIIALLRSQAAISTAAAQSVKDAEIRADAAEERERIARQKADDREDRLQRTVDDALSARRRAEDQHAEVMLEVRRLRYKVDQLQAELERRVPASGGEQL
jgi:biopolymer transport protein ExbB/TolQ